MLRPRGEPKLLERLAHTTLLMYLQSVGCPAFSDVLGVQKQQLVGDGAPVGTQSVRQHFT